MCFRDLHDELRREGINVTQSQIRWAINAGKIDRPSLDGSLRFVFGPDHLEQLRRLFAAKIQEPLG